jgi:hypothetical protein
MKMDWIFVNCQSEVEYDLPMGGDCQWREKALKHC